MAKELEEKETSTTTETVDGNAGVSERTEREIEAGTAGESKPGVDDDAKDADEALAELSEADPKRANVGLRKRLSKLTAQRNEARGKAAERDALAARVAAYEKRERDEEAARQDAQRRTPEGLKAEERRAAVRQTIDETYGEGASSLLEDLHEERRLAKEQYAQQGISHLRSELEDHNLKVDDKTLVQWERAVGSEMAEDPALLAMFRRPSTQADAIKEAVERVRGMVNDAVKQTDGKPLERITRNREAVLGGGRPTGAVEGAPEPEFDLRPPKELKGRALDDWWLDAREKYWKKLGDADRHA